MKRWFVSLVFGAAVLAVPLTVNAQNHPLPGSSSEPTVYCSGCPSPDTDLPLVAYSSPLKDHAGRFIDSARTGDWQCCPKRTYRASYAFVDYDRNRVYMKIGTSFMMWELSSFHSKLGGKLSNIHGRGSKAGPGPYEEYLPYDAEVYPESAGSGWKTRVMDGQEFFGGFDVDDRGYNYLAYTMFGWGIVKDPAKGGDFGPPVFQEFNPDVQPGKALVAKGSGGKYYLLISNGTKIQIYDVTNPASPRSLRILDRTVIGWAKLRVGSTDVVAITSKTGELQIYDADAIAGGGTPAKTFNGYVSDVTSGGGAFYAFKRGSDRTPATHIGRVTGGSTAASFSVSDTAISSGLYPLFIRWGEDHVTAGGGTSSGDLRIWKVEGSGLREIAMGTFFKDHYVSPPAGYAGPAGYTAKIRDAVVTKYNGKLYLIYSNHGIGDVYELEGEASLSVQVDSGRGYGTQNSFSPTRGEGPFYGDIVPFRSAYPTAISSNVNWDFDNPEAGMASSASVPLGATTYQYRRITSRTEIERVRTVKGSISNPASTDSVNVQLKAPTARIGWKKPSGSTVELVTGNSTRDVVAGEHFVDASDGVVEGHFSEWTSGSTTTATAPNQPWSVPGCGAGTLQLTPKYGPYVIEAGIAVPLDSSSYAPGAVSVSYDAVPFRAAMTPSSSGSTAPVVFHNASGIYPDATTPAGGPLFSAGANTEWTLKWEMLPAPGESESAMPSPQETILTIGSSGSASGNSWSVDRSNIKTGRKVRLTVSMAEGTVSGCVTSLLTSSVTYDLELPKPAISVEGCANEGSPCALSAIPENGATNVGWSTYRWTVNGNTRSSNATYSPSLTAGTHTIGLTVGNALGETTVTRTLNVEAAICGGKPTNVSFSYSGNQGCSTGAPCKAGESISFLPTAWGYQFQDCDSFAWNFGDGTTSSQMSPSKTYNSNGTREVSLTVTNSNGSETYKANVQIGEPTTEPPPSTCTLSGLYAGYTGNSSGCSSSDPSTACVTSESIRFQVSAGMGETIQSCHNLSWSFGDGTSSTSATPAKSYSQPGTYTVRVNAGGRSAQLTVNVTSSAPPACPTAAPTNAVASVSYTGTSSGCTAGGSSVCNRGEEIALQLQMWMYNVQSCDTIEWNFDDGSPVATTTGLSVNHVFKGAKAKYNVTAVIRNSMGTSPPLVGEVVFSTAPAEPIPTNVRITGPSSASTDQSVQFFGAADGNVTSWSWNFGDGTTSTQQNPTKSWSQAGEYTVTLRAGNNGGDAQATHKVTVTDGIPFAYLLPAVARLDGQGGTQWRTDWLVFNPDPAFNAEQPLELTLELHGSNGTYQSTKPFLMDSSTRVIEDIVKEVFGLESEAGSIIIRGVGAAVPQMWSRTYTVSASGVGTYGQLIPAVPISTSANMSIGPESYLISGLRGGAAFRTNVGVVNPSPTEVVVTLKATDHEGFSTVGSSRTFTVPPYSLKQQTLAQLFGGEAAADAPISMEISAEDGRPLVAYGSVIDMISNDPVYVPAVSAALLASGDNSRQILPGIGKVNSWQSDVTLYNTNGGGILVDLTYLNDQGEAVAEAKNVRINGGALVQLDDVLSDGHANGQLNPIPAAPVTGTLVVDVSDASATSFPLVFGRTYSNQGENGTFGQGIGAIPANGGNVRNGKPAFVPGVRNDAKYQTNVGVVALDTEKETVVRISILDRHTGQVAAAESHRLKPQQSIIASDIFKRVNSAAERATLKIEVLEGGAVWAYASVIDKLTFDPEYVPAIPMP